jgi:hypothetical protein
MVTRAFRWFVFWSTLAIETLGARRLRRVVEARLGRAPIAVEGAESLPRAGPFVLAVNHHRAGGTLELISAVLQAAARARPDTLTSAILVVGQRRPAPRRLLVRFLRRLAGAFFERWGAHLLRIPAGGDPIDVGALRAYRRRAREQPLLVFPEGIASVGFRGVRPNAGRWLSQLKVPVVPVGAWPDGRGGFRVVLGAPLRWADRGELRDLQLGLAIAAQLPAALAPDWQETLGRWRAVHQPNEEADPRPAA